MAKKIKGIIEKYEILILIMIGVAILRFPGLFEPNRYADEDIYLTLGMGIRRGLVLYRDIHDNKPPLIYLVSALAGSVMWLRMILLAWNLFNVAVVYKLADWFFGNKNKTILSTLLFGIFSTIPLLEGNIANGEIFMIMPVALGALIFVKEVERKDFRWLPFLAAGGLFSVGFLFKIPVVFDFAALMLWFVFFDFKKIFDKRLWLMVMGFVLPVVLSVIYYYLIGAGQIYVKAALLQNVGYVSSWEGSARPFYEGGLFQRGIVLLLVSWIIFVLKRNFGKKMSLVLLWGAWALFGTNLSGRPYPHYLIQMVTPLSILIISLMGERKKIVCFGSAMIMGLTVASIISYHFWYYQSWPYYQSFIKYAVWGGSKDEYWRSFSGNVRRNYEVANYIRGITEQDEKIFVWGTEPAIYVESDRLPVGKYTVSYHINDFKARGETIEKISKEKPKVIVIMDDEGDKFSELAGILMRNYIMVKRFDGARVYLYIPIIK